MTGELEKRNRCPVCGGHLRRGYAIVPFLLPGSVVVVKDVPAKICSSCHEPYTTGKVTDRLISLLEPFRTFKAEVLILPYSEFQPVSA
ncbi:MAG: type II toxin-antitoxin system MqsA family antitoxin [Anaerolineales bacterium]